MGQTKIRLVGQSELPPEKPRTTDETEKSAKSAVARKLRQRGKKYLAARAKVDPQKSYAPDEAAKLVRETSISRFNGSVELHLVLAREGFSIGVDLPHGGNRLQVRTEKKAPLAHLVVAKVNQPETEITENIEAVLNAVGAKNVKKAVVSSTMGPSIKLQL